MRAFLVFRLYGPLASWGDIAVGERRGSWNRPSKSALIGLLAAALGIDRHDRERQASLAARYGFGVRLDAPGIPLRDYHTTQTARQVDVDALQKTHRGRLTRRLVLSVPTPATILSQRDYYADALYTVGVWSRIKAPYPLARLRDALRQPHFALYLGRKSCPPGLPLMPEIIDAADLLGAFAAYRPPEPPGLRRPLAEVLNRHKLPVVLAWEDDVVPRNIAAPIHAERRRDVPGDRLRWHFGERDEQVAVLS